MPRLLHSGYVIALSRNWSPLTIVIALTVATMVIATLAEGVARLFGA